MSFFPDVEALFEHFFKQKKDDSESFYYRVAQHCGKNTLTVQEREEAQRARLAAIDSFEKVGVSAAPSPSLVFMVAWLLVQSDLSLYEGAGM